MANNNYVKMWGNRLQLSVRFRAAVYLEELRKTMTILVNIAVVWPGTLSEFPAYEAEILHTTSIRFFYRFIYC